MALSADLLAILCCPVCHADLEYDEEAGTLTCHACRMRYRVINDTPVMLLDQAERI